MTLRHVDACLRPAPADADHRARAAAAVAEVLAELLPIDEEGLLVSALV